MAANGLQSENSSIHELLKCPVCLETFSDPKTLTCLHSFCVGCLERCRKPYRRDLSCPVCKKVTKLPLDGVHGLQHDFRIQQIRDLLGQACQSPTSSGGASGGPPLSPVEAAPNSPRADDTNLCSLCLSQQRQNNAYNYCVQCYMYFCKACTEKHNENSIFETHHMMDLSAENATDVVFCKSHRDQPVRYYCRQCGSMLCTICTISHNPDHNPVPLDRSVVRKHQQDLQDCLKAVRSKLTEIKARTKYLETLKQSHQKALYEAQRGIREKAVEAIAQIQNEERKLLREVQQQMENKMRTMGLDDLGELNFHKLNIENVHHDAQKVIDGQPQNCLIMYEDLIGRMKSVAETCLPPFPSHDFSTVVKFIPAENSLDIQLGKIQECTLDDNDETSVPSPTSPTRNHPSPAKSLPYTPKRTTSILTALSPRKVEIRLGKLKNVSNFDKVKSNNTINADQLTESSTNSEPAPSTSAGDSTSPTSKGKQPSEQPFKKPKLVFQIDKVGGWPGRIMSPCAVSFLQDGNIVVAECENRLQIFDKAGQSVRIIGWGQIKPQGLAVNRDGKIAITDRKDKCVKVFSADGELVAEWGTGLFTLPAGIAASVHTGNIIVTDVDQHMVSVHKSDGTLLRKFGGWGSGEYQFNWPGYVAVDKHDNLFISDCGNNCVKVFDSKGSFLHKFSFTGGSQGQLKKPQGLCADQNGNVIVADHDNHRILAFNTEGKCARMLVTRQDSIKYPWDVAIDEQGNLAVVETHSGFLAKDPHHEVKLFKL